MIGAKRTLLSVLVSLVLVATAGASVWLMASAGVFSGAEGALPSAPTVAGGGAVAGPTGGGLSPSVELGQPRDPFQPLVTAPETPGGETTTTGAGGTTVPGTNTTVPGATTVPGGSTTTTVSDAPDGIRVKLLEVRETGSGRLAVLEVDGETYSVLVGETFATDFKVVSLTANGGVFTYRGSAFTLAVGQSILK
ncbi:MAG TPA: hypothetical protein VFY15_04990 [Acidimicrobiia bacterium]|nr:hypothetical protein [Acidimicrobiia bacterium]